MSTAKAKTKPAKKTKPIDPRLQRVFDVLEFSWQRLADNHVAFDEMVEELMKSLGGGVIDLAGAKRTLAALAATATDQELRDCAEAAELLHRVECKCCTSKSRAA